MKERAFGSIVASAVAGLFIMSAAHAEDTHAHDAKAAGKEDAKVPYCQNATCKGKSTCKGHGNACAGQNSCKGKGVVEAKDTAACTKAGGKWMPKG